MERAAQVDAAGRQPDRDGPAGIGARPPAGRAVNRRDWASMHALVSELEADFPQWRFAIRPGYGGPRVEAHRPQATSGLYALITADPAELRRELDNATPALMAGQEDRARIAHAS